MNAYYRNWILRDCQPGGWRRILSGPAKVETILVTSSNRDEQDIAFRMRLADNANNTLMMLEPEADIPPLRSDSFGRSSFTVMRGQHIEIQADQPGLDVLISGVER